MLFVGRTGYLGASSPLLLHIVFGLVVFSIGQRFLVAMIDRLTNQPLVDFHGEVAIGCGRRSVLALFFLCCPHFSWLEYGADNDLKLEKEESTEQCSTRWLRMAKYEFIVKVRKAERKHDLNRRGRANARPKKAIV